MYIYICTLYISLLHSNIYTKAPQDFDKILNTLFGFSLTARERSAHSKTSSNSRISWLWQL